MKYLEDVEYVSVAETKAKLSEKLRRIEKNGRRFAITSHGKPKAILISYNEYIGLTKDLPKRKAPRAKLPTNKQVKEVAKYITSKFDIKLLSKKGQKEYKSEKRSKRTTKNNKRS